MSEITTPNMALITDLLPTGWREQAKATKAFQRRGDHIDTPDDLLKILLLWSDLGSFGSTSAFLKETLEIPLNKNAVYERVQKSQAWVEWLAINFCVEHEYLVQAPEWLACYRVLAVDASNVSKPGSTNADYRLHTMIDMFSLAMAEYHLTTASTGESMTNFSTIMPNDLAIADRAYGTITSMNWLREKGAYFVYRLKAKSFNLYTKNSQDCFVRFELSEKLAEEWEEGKVLDLELYYRTGKEYYPVRVCAIGKTEEAIQAGTARIKRSNHGENRTKVTPLQEIFNKFIVVTTNLPASILPQQVLELYRMRWQIEMVFKRLKSIIHYDELLAKKDSTARTWFHCKLLVAAICETYVQRSYFPPIGDTCGDFCGDASNFEYPEVIMERIKNCLYSRNVDCNE